MSDNISDMSDTKSSLINTEISTLSKVEQVVNQLINYLQNEDVVTGDVVPTEKELSQNLNVSRPIIREALSHLKLLGMIEAKKKRGMTIKQPKFEKTLKKLLLPNLLQSEVRTEIFELRLMLEIGIAESLVTNVKEEDLKDLEDIISSEEKLMSGERTDSVISQLVDIDVNFHARLYAITKNDTLKTLQKMLLPTIEFVVKNQFQMDPLSYGSVSHQDLINTLRQRNAEKFRDAMKKHLSLHFKEIYN